MLPALIAICHTLSVSGEFCVQPSAQGNSKTFFCSPIDEIQQEIKEQKDVERHMKNMSNDLIKLNTLITKNNSSVEELQNGKMVTESEFLQSLKVLGHLLPRSQPPVQIRGKR